MLAMLIEDERPRDLPLSLSGLRFTFERSMKIKPFPAARIQ
jgi:hypothetical protein